MDNVVTRGRYRIAQWLAERIDMGQFIGHSACAHRTSRGGFQTPRASCARLHRLKSVRGLKSAPQMLPAIFEGRGENDGVWPLPEGQYSDPA